MSLHAQLSPEALARLNAQKRNSTITSLAISILTIVLLFLVLGLFLLDRIVKEAPVPVVYQTPEEEEITDDPKPKKTLDKKPTPSSTSMAKVITSVATADITIPVPDITLEAPSLEFGDSMDFNQDWGGGSSQSMNIPASMKKRCSESDRAKRMKESGGNPKCEKAVVDALEYFKKTQNEDGSWDNANQPAMTGLVLLAYLGHCETPQSQKYGDTVSKAITYLINVGMKNDGKLTTDPGNKHWCYEHAIATYALGEAYTFCKQIRIPFPNLENVTKKAGQYIVDKQGPNGGWGYGYGGDGDLSIIGWQLQAIKAIDHSGIKLKGIKDCIAKATKNLGGYQTPDGGFNYGKNGSNPRGGVGYRNLTGVGVLCLQIWGEGKSKPALDGIAYIAKNAKFEYAGKSSDIYGHYYMIQAMINAGGKEWDQYNNMVQGELLKSQESNGAWSKAATSGSVSPTYRTALCTLMLEAYYRFLPSADGSH